MICCTHYQLKESDSLIYYNWARDSFALPLRVFADQPKAVHVYLSSLTKQKLEERRFGWDIW